MAYRHLTTCTNRPHAPDQHPLDIIPLPSHRRHPLILPIRHQDATRLQLTRQRPLLVSNHIPGTKRFEMCFANVRHYRNVWLRDRTELRNIAGISRAHLQNQHLMRGLQIVVDDFADPHRRVETPRRGADLIPLPQQGIDHKFGAGFAITPGDGNHFQVRKAGKFLPCLSFKALLDLFFHRFYQPASEQQQQRSNHIYQQQHKR